MLPAALGSHLLRASRVSAHRLTVVTRVLALEVQSICPFPESPSSIHINTYTLKHVEAPNMIQGISFIMPYSALGCQPGPFFRRTISCAKELRRPLILGNSQIGGGQKRSHDSCACLPGASNVVPCWLCIYWVRISNLELKRNYSGRPSNSPDLESSDPCLTVLAIFLRVLGGGVWFDKLHCICNCRPSDDRSKLILSSGCLSYPQGPTATEVVL